MSAPQFKVADRATDCEPLHLMALRVLCYWGAIALFVSPIASWPGVVGALTAAVAGIIIARRLAALEVRTPVVIAGCLVVVLLGQAPEWFSHSRYAARLLGVSTTLHLVDAATFFLFTLAATVLLRALASKTQLLRLVELATIVAPVVYLCAGHRDMKLG